MGCMNLSAARGLVRGLAGTYSFSVQEIQLMEWYRTRCKKTVREKQELAPLTEKKSCCLKNSAYMCQEKTRIGKKKCEF